MDALPLITIHNYMYCCYCVLLTRNGNDYCGGGGGRSAIQSQTQANVWGDLATAAGGGGGGWWRNGCWFGGYYGGLCGGGEQGCPATNTDWLVQGTSGTQTAGGIAGSTSFGGGPGSQYQGGLGGGGGGGGGYFGGGGGGDRKHQLQSGGGGGGSSYIGGCAPSTGTYTLSGLSSSGPNAVASGGTDDAFYVANSGVGVGGYGIGPVNGPYGPVSGGNGRVLILGPAVSLVDVKSLFKHNYIVFVTQRMRT